jgi:SAM-dependent methyltransferase
MSKAYNIYNNRLEFFDVAKEYDNYYRGGERSLYDNRFGKEKIIPRENQVIVESFKRIYKKLETKIRKNEKFIFRIMDFGCGNGRLFPIIDNLSQNFNINIELIAYDASLVGLELFQKNLESKGYKKIENIFLNNFKMKDHTLSFLVKNNLSIRLVHANTHDESNHIINIFDEPIHFIFSFYSVFGHILKRQNRLNILKSLKATMHPKGEIIINVCTRRSVSKQLEVYDNLREQYKAAILKDDKTQSEFIKKNLMLATEAGDFYKVVYDNIRTIHLYGHAYTSKELLEDFTTANLIPKKVKIISIEQPYALSRSRVLRFVDTILSTLLSLNIYPFFDVSKFSKNIYVIGRK